MALQSTNIDDLTFDRLFAVLRGQITTGWTDHNPSDPGIMFLELFCWLGEIMLYRMNRVPDSHRAKFLNLLIDPPEPAVVPVTFSLTTAGTATDTLSIPAATRVATEFAGGRRSVFETLEPRVLQLPGAAGVEVSVTVTARELTEVLGQELGLSDGAPSQTFEIVPPRAALGLEPDHAAPILLDDTHRSPDYDPNPRILVSGAATTAVAGPVFAGNGVAAIRFDPAAGSPPVTAENVHFLLQYAQASRELTLVPGTGTPETAALSPEAATLNPEPIPAGATEEAAFPTFGLTLVLDEAFDKTVDIPIPASSATVTGGSGAIDALSIEILETRGSPGRILTDTLSIDNLATPADLHLTLNPGFTGALDGASAGPKQVVLRGPNGDSLTIGLDVAAAFDGTETLASMTIGALANLIARWREPWEVRHSLLTEASRVDPLDPATARYATLDPIGHMVRFGDDVFGRIPRIGSRIDCESYRVLTGPSALIEAGEIRYLLDPIPGLTAALGSLEVRNEDDAAGGANFFPEDERLAAGLASLRQPYRMVTAADFEGALPEAFNAYQELAGRPERIDRTLAFMNRRPPLSENRVRPGDVTLMVIRRLDASQQAVWDDPATSAQDRAALLQMEDPRLAAPAPDPLGRRLVRFLEDRRLITTQVYLTSPDLIAVGIQARVILEPNRDQLAMGAYIREAVLGFLDLLAGGFDGRGWRPGRSLYRSEIYRLLEGIEGVDHVESLSLTPADANGDVAIGDHQMPLAGAVDIAAVRV